MATTDIDLYSSDYGVTIRLDCKVDVSGASQKKILIKKPSGEVQAVDGTIDPTNTNRIYYTLPNASSPIDEGAGTYIFRADITFDANRRQQGDPASLYIGSSWAWT